jgi:hypothetical protein
MGKVLVDRDLLAALVEAAYAAYSESWGGAATHALGIYEQGKAALEQKDVKPVIVKTLDRKVDEGKEAVVQYLERAGVEVKR